MKGISHSLETHTGIVKTCTNF